MALTDVNKYKKRIVPVVGRCKMSGLDKKDFILLKAYSHSGVYSKFSLFLMDAKKEKALSRAQERKRDNAANHPANC